MGLSSASQNQHLIRLILAGPTPLRGGATQKCGGEAPAIIFVCPSQTRVGAAEDEVMEMMIDWGSGTPHLPDSLLVGSYIIYCSISLICERTIHFRVIVISIFRHASSKIHPKTIEINVNPRKNHK